jgi:aromatic ring-opening dioxygenase LigB subunit
MPENTEQNRELPQAFIEKQWKPGQSGNPGGRPKKKLVDEALLELLEAADSKEAIEIAKKLIEKAKEDTKAAQLVAERTQGKPSQKVEVSGPDGGPVQGEFVIKFVKAE